MNTTRIVLAITTLAALSTGCAAVPQTTFVSHRAPVRAGCQELAFDRQNLAFRCDERTYELLQTPVRSRRIFDIVTRERFTRRHFIATTNGQRYVYRTEQMEGAGFPARVVLETRRGFMLLKLDKQGQVVSSAVHRGSI